MAGDDCMFLSLPPEIRNSIYELVLTVEPNEAGFVTFSKRPATGNNAKTHTAQAILQTCKQVYDEALHIFYSVNKVLFRHLRVNTFLNDMGARRLSLIKSIAVDFVVRVVTATPSFKFLDHLQKLPRLDVLTIVFSPAYCANADSVSGLTGSHEAVRRIGKLSALREIRVITPGMLYAPPTARDRVFNAGRKFEDLLNSAIAHHRGV